MLPARTRRAVLACAAGVLIAPVVGGCTSADGSNETHLTAQQVLAAAKKQLDETSGVALSLSTSDLPDGVTGIEKAQGTGTHAPAFDGTITVVLSGQAFEVPVVAVDRKVYVQLPLTTGWQDIDPSEYGAPDPAQLMSPDRGFSSLLPATTGLEQGKSVRGGTDNKEVLTTYTGTVGAETVKNVIPTASGDFDAAYTVTSDHQLRTATLTGVFYKSSPSMTYTVTFDSYGTQKDITKP
jgi:lipoprotein LprG